MRRRTLTLAAALIVIGAAGPAAGADRIAELAKDLSALRAEVDRLAESIESTKSSARASARSHEAQASELELQLQRAELRARRLEAEAISAGEGAASLNEARQTLEPVLESTIERARRSIRGGLPFKVDERLETLAAIERELEAGTLPPERAAARLWSFLEDEGRLARESGLYRQTITIEGGEVLTDVARLGMVALYFRTADGRAGYMRRDGDQWRGVTLKEPEAIEAIGELFDAFGRGLRVGYFRLPNALVSP